MTRRNFTVDELLEMKDAGAVTSSGAATVDSVAHIEDIGAGFVEGNLVVDITAIETGDGDERFDILIQGSNDETFASTYYDLAASAVGASGAINSDVDTGTGRLVIPFTNDFMGSTCRYVRCYTDVSGSVSTGVNYTARLAI